MKKILLVIISLISILVSAQSKNGMKIPFRLTAYNNILIPVVLNKKDTLQLMFHTGSDYISVIEDVYKKMKSVNVTDTIANVISWGGSDNLKLSKNNTVSMGSLYFEHIPVFIDQQSGHESGGKIGLAFFEGKYLEIDFDENQFIVYDTPPGKLKNFVKLKSTYKEETLYVEGFLVMTDQKIKTSFMIHTGYSGAFVFSDQFAKDNQLMQKLTVTGESKMSDAAGNTILAQKAILPLFRLADEELQNVPVTFFDSHIKIQNRNILGGDVLKRYNLILAADLNAVYFRKNSHFKDVYFNI